MRFLPVTHAPSLGCSGFPQCSFRLGCWLDERFLVTMIEGQPLQPLTMENLSLLLGIMALTLAGVTYHAWRLGNEKRDVALLGAFGACFGIGATASAWL